MNPDIERGRLRALHSYGVLDTLPEQAFDRLTALAADLFDVPIALVSLIDEERQWFKSRQGLDATSTPRSLAFCAHAIEQAAATTFVVEDASVDPRFSANPLVTSDPDIRFYAGAVLTNPDGFNLGTLCVIDTKARQTPDARTLARLQTLAQIVVDELELRRATQQALEGQRLLELAESVAGLGHWRLDTRTKAVTWSKEMFRIYGLESGSDLDLRKLLAMTHPDDAKAGAERLTRQMATGGGLENALTRIIRADGEVRYLSGKSNVERGPDGEVVAVVGTIIDITEQKMAEIATAKSELRFRTLAETAPDMITETTLDGIVTYVSQASVRITGYTPEEITGRSYLSLVHPEDADTIRVMTTTVFGSKGKVAPWPIEFRAIHKNGKQLWLESKPCLVRDPDTGRFTGLTDVIRDVTARKTMEAELRQARAEAEAAAQVKSEFLANMSHELRTPLTSILGFTRLASDQGDLTDLTRDYIGRVGNASQALLCTVNDILDFSKLEAGQVTIAPQAVALDQLAQGTLDLFTPQAGAKDLHLSMEITGIDGRDAVMVDPDRIRQVLLNLVGNAVKFTGAGGVSLKIAYEAQAASLTVAVMDTGGGIPADKLGQLFKRFSQVEGSLARGHGGTGLGLAICKGLVEAMGGKIGADSVEGQGSCFWFVIPAPLAPRAATAQTNTGVNPPILHGVRILVVDDHAANRELARLYLAGVGAEITEACDGVEAVEVAAHHPFDLILMDMRMPRMDGPTALVRIRQDDGPNDATPIIAFTADAHGEPEGLMRQYGFQGVVAKPMEVAQLLSEVARLTAFDLPADDEGESRVA